MQVGFAKSASLADTTWKGQSSANITDEGAPTRFRVAAFLNRKNGGGPVNCNDSGSPPVSIRDFKLFSWV